MSDTKIPDDIIVDKFKKFQKYYPYAKENELRDHTYEWVMNHHRSYYHKEPDSETVSGYLSQIKRLTKENSNELLSKAYTPNKWQKPLGYFCLILGILMLIVWPTATIIRGIPDDDYSWFIVPPILSIVLIMFGIITINYEKVLNFNHKINS
jgi:hypothetical protein